MISQTVWLEPTDRRLDSDPLPLWDSRPLSKPTPTHQRRCVIADDIRSSRELARKWLGDKGYQCAIATNGKEAWRLILESTPQLVLTDLEMPVASGLSLIHSIRNHENATLRQVPVIAMTSLSDDRLEPILEELGATAVIEKPIEKTSMNQVIDCMACVDREYSTQLPTDVPSKPQGRVSPALQRLIADIRILE